MTAEIAVYNKNCVALSADSAVTISGLGMHKIYNGAEKLFALTKHHPVGLMVFGSGNLSSSPWELVIKEFRRKLGKKSYKTLEEYAEKFFLFVESSTNIITEGMREESTFRFLSENVFKSLLDAYQSSKDNEFWVNFDINKFYVELEAHCHELLQALSETDFLDDFNADDIDSARDYCKNYTEVILNAEIRDQDTPTPESLLEVVNEIFATMLCKKSDIGNISGLVLAGYGDDDYYPKVLAYDVCGFFKGKLRKAMNEGKCSANGISGVTPFAQDDEVMAFMQGGSQNLINQLHTEYKGCLATLLEHLDDVISDSVVEEKQELVKEKIIAHAKSSLSETNQKISEFMRVNYINKVVNMVEFLPKQDIAYMAESLVNLTAFKRKVSDDSETVGGPIDVAVISKSDGFIWVKRKHYFDKEMNYHFFARP
ncbi:hypothetical protein AB9C95_15360 [Serratia marcescens]|uniref:hypothetical protein n=1 Tax=Serratia marcescens TaxID=615 RepID=UPI00350EDAF6